MRNDNQIRAEEYWCCQVRQGLREVVIHRVSVESIQFEFYGCLDITVVESRLNAKHVLNGSISAINPGEESAATASSCILLQEPLWPEVFGVFPVGQVVGEPPGVDEDLALGQDVVAAELGVVEIHVGDEERDGHA
ncbi:hypothetical protein KSP40_PGU001636 [Platanthera guangdongensis]|uniref:Uncharacterized protein n=1 Tax=Platanthera guangdongensis TaxID=2320717 RepID=A0ABR2MBM0_9ASPA